MLFLVRRIILISFIVKKQEITMSPIAPLLRLLAALSICSAALVLSGCSSPEGNVTEGKKWYIMHNCNSCHGDNGDDGNGPAIAGLDMSHRAFVSRLRNAETAVMPVYSKEKIDDQDAADILAYLKNLEKK
jgi:mono/diheme cytochrome c family protein